MAQMSSGAVTTDVPIKLGREEFVSLMELR